MANLKIDTVAVTTAANNIGNINKQIRDSFDQVESAIKRLDSSWDGSVSTAAIGKFNEMKSKYVDARFKVMENYRRFLLEQVGQGYVQTEDVNKKLSEKFK